MVFEAVAKVIAERTDCNASEVKLEHTFKELNIDSLDTVEMRMNLEDALNVEIELPQKVETVVPSVAMAKLVTRLGASAVIAEGGESGGHVGELTTMVLVPLIRDATHLPVIAAGGIADGRGVAAAFMLGACGVQMGTRFLAAEECSIHENYKQKILD